MMLPAVTCRHFNVHKVPTKQIEYKLHKDKQLA